jgi:hypothetical protein
MDLEEPGASIKAIKRRSALRGSRCSYQDRPEIDGARNRPLGDYFCADHGSRWGSRALTRDTNRLVREHHLIFGG